MPFGGNSSEKSNLDLGKSTGNIRMCRKTQKEKNRLCFFFFTFFYFIFIVRLDDLEGGKKKNERLGRSAIFLGNGSNYCKVFISFSNLTWVLLSISFIFNIRIPSLKCAWNIREV
eukprot:TRINITY_DN10480_c0_g2_i1.p2 TRINITY_DN10480_c0_g2~~TRINITY_DN10480_c0_g2_i1.p2  ORF type:complete len:115 (+),score=3.76 TRINITY_DN10480_c0_g2_i1:346-690(+)